MEGGENYFLTSFTFLSLRPLKQVTFMQTQTRADNQTGDFDLGFVNLTNNLHLVSQGQLRSIAESK